MVEDTQSVCCVSSIFAMQLEIFLSTNATVTVAVNNCVKQVSGNDISIDTDVLAGFNKISVSSNTPCKILDVKIDGDSVRELLYLSYTTTESGEICNPDTELSSNKQWIFPILYPLSFFVGYVKSTIPNGILGSNIFDSYKFYYPESVLLSTDFPNVIIDFFQRDAVFGIVKKTNNMVQQIPFVSAPDYAQVTDELIKKLVSNNIDCNVSGSSSLINANEYNASGWRYSYFIKAHNSACQWQERFVWDKDNYPELIDFLNLVPDQNIIRAFYAELMPHSFIYPHQDSFDKSWNNSSMTRYYIPLSVNDRVYFKFSNYGTVDLTTNNFVNVRNHVHAVVNNSDQVRKILAIDVELGAVSVNKYFNCD